VQKKRERLQLFARHKMPLAILNGREQYEKCDFREPAEEKRLLQTAPSPYRSHLSRGYSLRNASPGWDLSKQKGPRVKGPDPDDHRTKYDGDRKRRRGTRSDESSGASQQDGQPAGTDSAQDLIKTSHPSLWTNSSGLLCILIPEPAKTQAHSSSF